MNLSQIANIADILAGLGVIASLIFVGLELRRNTNQAKLENWTQQVDRFITIYTKTSDIDFSNLLAKGHKNYHDLSEGEKISFSNHLEQLCIGLESILTFSGGGGVHNTQEMQSLFKKHIQSYLGSPGGNAWYNDFQKERGFPASVSKNIDVALRELSDNEQ